MVSDAFARRMRDLRDEARRGVPVESLREVRRPAIVAAAPSGADESIKANGYYVVGSLAIVPISGPIWAEESFWTRLFGGCTVSGLTRTFGLIERDPKVSRVLLDIDSPGGVSQQYESIAALQRLREAKPVHALAHPDANSAAYRLANQADEIVVTPDAIVGSIGTRLGGALYDFSGLLEEEGIVAHGVSTGKHKLTGEFGLPIDEEQLAHMRDLVESLFELFAGEVSERRGLSIERIRAMEGGVMVGARAVAAGLADRVVESMDDLVTELAGMRAGERAARKPPPPETASPAPDEPEPSPAVEPDEPEEHSMADSKTDKTEKKDETRTEGKTEAREPQSNGGTREAAGPATFDRLEALASKLPEPQRDSFITSCMRGKMTEAQATDALVERALKIAADAESRATMVEAQNADLRKLGDAGKGVSPVSGKPGNAAGGGGGGGSGTAANGNGPDALGIADCASYEDAVKRVSHAKGITMHEARGLVHKDPIGRDLRAKFVASISPTVKS